ncbi:MAG: iron ABC transporter permease [Alphaproteobacteria bacterium]|nr:iron ABC transporter permease [Alphaproteobacteria bacterium]
MRRGPLIALLLVGIALLAMLSLMSGRALVPFSAWLDPADPRWAIVFELRLPRTLLAIMIGAALGMSGAAMQGYTRNPLADPGILGVSSLAALGAVMTLYFGFTSGATWILPVAAVAGAVLSVFLLVALAGFTASVITFVLAGVILQSVAGSAVALALSLAPNPWAAQEIMNWLLGSLTDRSIQEVKLAAPFIAAGLLILWSTRRALDALSLGEASAASLGVNLPRTQLLIALGVGLATGASVAVSGIIGFVGLIVPHLIRWTTGATPGALLLPSALGGAALVLAGDTLMRLVPLAVEMKLGVAMSAIGGPFFLAMLIAMRRRTA